MSSSVEQMEKLDVQSMEIWKMMISWWNLRKPANHPQEKKGVIFRNCPIDLFDQKCILMHLKCGGRIGNKIGEAWVPVCLCSVCTESLCIIMLACIFLLCCGCVHFLPCLESCAFISEPVDPTRFLHLQSQALQDWYHIWNLYPEPCRIRKSHSNCCELSTPRTQNRHHKDLDLRPTCILHSELALGILNLMENDVCHRTRHKS